MAKNKGRLVDEKWEEIFNDHPIIEEVNKNGCYKITSSEINNYREARLMTKFDHRKNLPYIFTENNLTILPISRGEYIIGNYEVYQDINLVYDNIKPKEFSFPGWIESINPKNLFSESAALQGAFVSGILNDLVQKDKLISTVSGRMSTKTFDFNIGNKKTNKNNKILVENSQCEIDGGYETDDRFILIEAKNSLSQNFLIRQLYYPYRLWLKKLNKKVTPIFMIYSNDIFSFFVYEFEDPLYYNSLRLIKQENYIIKEEKTTLNDLKSVYKSVKTKPEPEVPFPQADSFIRVLDLIKALYEENLNIEDISTRYDFDIRQANYYSSAARYLGLVEKVDDKFQLTPEGFDIIDLNVKERNLALAKSILEHEIFYKVFQLYLKKSGSVSKPEVEKIMLDNINKIYNVNSESTVRRRAQTVIKWIEWIFNLERNK